MRGVGAGAGLDPDAEETDAMDGRRNDGCGGGKFWKIGPPSSRTCWKRTPP